MQFFDCERQMDEYTELGNAIIPDEFKCAIVLRWAPKEVKQFLRNTCTIDCSKEFETLRQQLWLFFTRHRVFDEQGQARKEAEVAELKAMLAWLKGKGKGGDKGKGKKGKGKDAAKGKGSSWTPWSQGAGKGKKGNDAGKKGERKGRKDDGKGKWKSKGSLWMPPWNWRNYPSWQPFSWQPFWRWYQKGKGKYGKQNQVEQETTKEEMNFGDLQASAEQQYEQNGEWTLPFYLNPLESRFGKEDACCNDMEDYF